MSKFKHSILNTLFFALASGMFAATALAQPFQEGTHFDTIEGPDVEDRDGEIEVVEVFSYMCPHCGNFQPYVEAWHEQLPEGVSFSRAPVSFNPSWETFARAYYTAEVLDLLDQSHSALFQALHQERRAIRSMDDLAAFHAQYGIDAERFTSTAKSFPVESKMRMGNASIAKWQVRSTPTLVINGKYRVSPRRGGTFDEMLQVADWLIAQELGERAKNENAAP
jgi:thiol:disulfide interchange protein DsbA